MRRVKYNTLATRLSTIAHWRFRNSLADTSPNGRTLTGENVNAASFRVGYTENGITMIKADSADTPASRAYIPAASAAPFDFGTSSVTIEIIFRTDAPPSSNLVRKYSTGPNRGIRIYTTGELGANKLRVDLADGTSTVALTSVSGFTYGAWHHVAVVVNRAAGQLTLYIDGAGAGGVAIPALGSISNATADFNVQSSNRYTYIDEVCVSAEALSSSAIAERAAGEWVEELDVIPDFMMGYLPRVYHSNPSLQEFLTPFDQMFQAIKGETEQLPDLVEYDACPSRFLPHMASQFGFELIDAPFATEAERREMLRWVLWIYRRKGTAAAAKKIIELLGFTYTWNEVFPDAVPFIANYHSVWDRHRVATSEFSDAFSMLSGWDYPLAYDSSWSIVASRLRGTGNGSDDPKNAITRNSSLSVYRIEASYAVVSGLTSADRLGIYLKWVDTNNYIALVVKLDATDQLVIERKESGTVTTTVLFTLSGNLTSSQYRTGQHRLWLFADHTTNKFTGGLDDRTLFLDVEISMANPASTKKGLLVNKTLAVDWDDFNIQSLNYSQAAVTWTEAFLSRKVQVALFGTPVQEAAKRLYLADVLREYLPAGVELELS